MHHRSGAGTVAGTSPSLIVVECCSAARSPALPTVNRGLTASATATTADMLSDTSTANTPLKNRHAASHPAMIADRI